MPVGIILPIIRTKTICILHCNYVEISLRPTIMDFIERIRCINEEGPPRYREPSSDFVDW